MAKDNIKTSKSESLRIRKNRFDLKSFLPFFVLFITYLFLPRALAEKHEVTLIFIGINVLLALGLNLLMGYAGQISLGHAAFFGIGAYTSAILAVKPVPSEIIPGISFGIGVMTACAVLISFTRLVGWKLTTGVILIILLSWVVRITHLNLILMILIYGVALTAFGLAVKLCWWKCGVSGISGAASTGICSIYLTGVLARGSSSPWIGMLAGVFVTCLIAYLIGGQVLRLKGHYLAMATLGFGVIIEIVLRQWTAVTGGSSDGIFGIPTIILTDILPLPFQKILKIAAGGNLDQRTQYYYLVWGFVIIALVIATNIVRSRVGRAMHAVHGSEVAAESLGVDTARYKVQVFVLSAAMASIAGSLYAHNAGIGYVNPGEFSFMVSVQLVVMVVVGGMASIWGALVGAAAIQLLKNWLMSLEKADISFFGVALKGLDPIVFGAVLIIVMILMPQGLTRGLTDSIASSLRRIITSKKVKGV
jgi:branched-chain amino acid transport system permease protein